MICHELHEFHEKKETDFVSIREIRGKSRKPVNFT